jgi:hypothetical protein
VLKFWELNPNINVNFIIFHIMIYKNINFIWQKPYYDLQGISLVSSWALQQNIRSKIENSYNSSIEKINNSNVSRRRYFFFIILITSFANGVYLKNSTTLSHATEHSSIANSHISSPLCFKMNEKKVVFFGGAKEMT